MFDGTELCGSEKEKKKRRKRKKRLHFDGRCSNIWESVKIWSVGQAVKTPPSHGGNRGSIPLRTVEKM